MTPSTPQRSADADFMLTPVGLIIQVAAVGAVSLLLPPTLIWFPLGLAITAGGLMALSNDRWRDLGFYRPQVPALRWVLEGAVTGLLWQLVTAGILLPALNALFGRSPAPGTRAGDLAYLIYSIILFGILQALAKGLGHRGFLLNRLERIFGWSDPRPAEGLVGGNAPAAMPPIPWVPVLIGSVLFGLANWFVGPIGVISAMFAGLVFNLLYYWSRRNIWPTIVAHAVYNTTLFVLIYLGRA